MAEVDDYESDPDDAIVPSAMRRTEASDDEERSDGGHRRRDRMVDILSGGESDGQGAYDEEQEDDDELYEDEIEEDDELVEDEEEKRGDVKDLEVSRGEGGEGEDDKGEGDENKKENEPYAVPTAGAFYMHDDRFRKNWRGRQRRVPGGRELWESKDNHAWIHDRFEEMNLQDLRYGQGSRNSRGRFRGRGGAKTRGAGRGHAEGNNNSRVYYEDGYTNSQNRDGGNHSRTQKSVRGRGPRRYEPRWKNKEIYASQPKLLAKSQLTTVDTTRRQSSQSTNLQPNPSLSRKHVFASSLNSASPPFYPLGSSKHDITVNQKRDAQTGNTDQTISSSMCMETSFMSSQSSSMSRGKAVVDSVNSDRLYVDDSLCSVAGKALANSQVEPSGSSFTCANAIQSSHFRAQARNISMSTPPNYQPTASVSQVPEISVQIQSHVAHQRSQTENQTSLRVSTLQVGQHRHVSGNQVSSSPHVQSATSSELGEVNLPPGSSKTQTQLITNGKGSSNGTGMGSVLYAGAQVIAVSGAMGLSRNDQGFPATPALFPVMQLGAQHPGGLGIPAVGMAFPGYVAQPQLGFGNSEMTWVPVLAGAAGALGASYPYIALDGSYYPHSSGQSSSLVFSRETSKPTNTLNPAQQPEIVNDEFGQRHNKPRRYSDMNFGQ